MKDLWFEISDGGSMDQEKATLVKFRHLLDDAQSARLLGSDQQILLLATALHQIDQLIKGRTDASFRLKGMVDGESYSRFASSPTIEIEYTMTGPPQLSAIIGKIVAKAREECLAAR